MADLDGKSEEYPDIHRLALSSVDKFGLFHPCGPPAGHFLDGKLHIGVSLRFVTVQNQVTEVFGERTTP
ncbi:MAG: hypothetical protein C0433_04105, partial [Cyclobacterium sp.]|nr:hypothetical protein [Cyclobacterium sp.]